MFLFNSLHPRLDLQSHRQKHAYGKLTLGFVSTALEASHGHTAVRGDLRDPVKHHPPAGLLAGEIEAGIVPAPKERTSAIMCN